MRLTNPLCFVALASIVIATSTCAAVGEDAQAKIPVAAGPTTIPIEDTKAFYKSFEDAAKSKPRGEFETREDYAKRQPAPWDADKTIYLAIHGSPTSQISDKASLCDHSYDIDRQVLTVKAGWGEINPITDNADGTHCLHVGILNDVLSLGTQEKQNAFGATRTVSSGFVTTYDVSIVNYQDLPAGHYDPANNEIMMSVDRGPIAAESLSKTAEIVLAVKPIGYDACYFGVGTAHSATFSDPVDVVSMVNDIKVKLCSVLVVDTSTGLVVSRLDIANNQNKDKKKRRRH